MRTTPAVGRSRVPITCSRVLLPDPDGPTMATSSPWSMRRSTPARATTGGSPGYSLTTSTSSRTGAGAASSAGREDGDGHDEGTSTRVPAVMPGPADLDQGVAVEAGGDPDQTAGAAGHHVHAEPAALEGQQGVHRHGQHVVGPLGGDVDVHRGLVQGGAGRGAVQGDGDRHRRGGRAARSARRAGRLVGRAGPLPVPLPPPPGQVATLPTVSMWPPTVVVPSGSTTVTASPGLTRYSWVTSKVDGDDGRGAGGRQHRATPAPTAACHSPPPPTEAPTDGVTDVTRMGPGSKTTSPSRISPVAGSPSARLPTLHRGGGGRRSSGCSGSARRRSRGRSGRGSARPHRRRRTCPT